MKKMRKYSTFIILVVFLLTASISQDAPQSNEPAITTSYITAEGGESLDYLLRNIVGIPSKILDQRGYFYKIREWNPHIRNHNMLTEGTKVYIELPYGTYYSPYKPAKVAKRKPKPSRKIASVPICEEYIPPEKKEKKTGKKNFSLSVFYTLSRGTFEEDVESVSATSTQDSPATLGLAMGYGLSKSFSLSSSFYASKLNGSVSAVSEQVDIPIEYGANFYLNYYKRNWIFTPYIGADYERFSTYNVDELPYLAELSTREHYISYATIGIMKAFKLFNSKLFFKGSYSKTLSVSSSRESLVSNEIFSGNKYILYLNLKLSKRWLTHFLFKQHNLVGPTNLKITRYGLGVGYVLF